MEGPEIGELSTWGTLHCSQLSLKGTEQTDSCRVVGRVGQEGMQNMDCCEPTPWPPLGLGSVSILLWSSLTFFLHLPGSVPLNASEIWSIFSSCGVVKTYSCSCYLTQIFGLCPNPCAACWPIMSIPEERNREKPPFGGGFVPYLKNSKLLQRSFMGTIRE